MSLWMFVVMVAAGGAMLAFQPPINAALREHVGVFESALISFLVGTVILIVVVLLAGKGQLTAVRNASWWQLLGGVIGAIFVTATLLSAKSIGVTGTIVATLAGQMTAAVLIDRFGWAGMTPRPIDLPRIAGVALLVVAVALINWSTWKKA